MAPVRKMAETAAGYASWVQSKGRNSTWHITPKAEPTFIEANPTVCGKTLPTLNVTWSEAPYVADFYVCARCVAKIKGETVTQVIVQAIKDHAIANYESGGWDVIVECYEDEQIAKLVGKATTVKGGFAKVKSIVSVYADYQADAINSAF